MPSTWTHLECEFWPKRLRRFSFRRIAGANFSLGCQFFFLVPFPLFLGSLAGETAPRPFFALTLHGGLFFEEVRPDQCDRTEHPGRQTVIWIDRPFWPGCACHVALIGPHLLEHHWPKRGSDAVRVGRAISGSTLPIGSEGSSPAAAELSVPQQPCIRYDPFGVGDHDAVMRIGGEAPKGGPNLQARHEGHGRMRDTATSDRHRQRLAEADARRMGIISWLSRSPLSPASAQAAT